MNIRDLDINKYFVKLKSNEPIYKYIDTYVKMLTDEVNINGRLRRYENPYNDFYRKFYYNLYIEQHYNINKFKYPVTWDESPSHHINKNIFGREVNTLTHKNKRFLDISKKIISDIFRKYSSSDDRDYCNLYMFNNIYNFEVLEPTESKLGGTRYYYDYRGMWWVHLLRPKRGCVEIYLNANNNYDIFIYYLVGYEKGYKLKKALNNIPQRLVHSKLNDVFIRYTPSYLKELKMEKEKEFKIKKNAMKKAEKNFKENKTINDNPYKNDTQKFYWEYKFRELKAKS